MSKTKSAGGGAEAARREAERANIETRVRTAIARNQEVLRAAPTDASDAEYWGALRREGMPSTLRVRDLTGSGVTEQPEIYLLGETDGQIEMTYFDGDEVGEAFFIAMDRVESIV